ncbi:MAG: M28 family peptidase [Candidatus Micrarchaeia archaeon]|uniref:M28 family peptidase n=1 Tax=candidate division WOR-3 bacterium TaxID=2052148 RepID=A0A7V4E185_UNCW3
MIKKFLNQKENLDLLETLLGSPTKEVRDFIINFFEDERVEVDVSDLSVVVNKSIAEDNIILVSHYDIFHDQENYRKVIFKDGVMTSPDGLGADDRAGVWSLLMIYKYLKENSPDLMPVFIFTDKEEEGCLGAEEVAFLYDLSDANFLIELDRKNSNDCVFYNDEPKEFIKYIESFGFKEERGTRSDIQVLGKAWNLCSTNLSVGYYKAHTLEEYLIIDELFSTVEKVVEILKANKKNPRKFRLGKEVVR